MSSTIYHVYFSETVSFKGLDTRPYSRVCLLPFGGSTVPKGGGPKFPPLSFTTVDSGHSGTVPWSLLTGVKNEGRRVTDVHVSVDGLSPGRFTFGLLNRRYRVSSVFCLNLLLVVRTQIN